jgi:hypothetical protein
MTDDLVNRTINVLERLEGERNNFDWQWQQIADYVLPSREFTQKRNPGARRGEKIFDATAPQALVELAGGLHGLMTSQATKWFAIVPEDPELAEDEEAAAWCDAVTDRMWRRINSPDSNFHSAAHEFYLDCGGFGQGVISTLDMGHRGVRYMARPLAECYIAEGADGLVDTVYRSFPVDARQAVQLFPGASEKLDALAKDEPKRSVRIVHCVMPREEYRGDRYASRNKPFASLYIWRDEKLELTQGGFDELPYHVARWEKRSGEVYGSGPGHTALADIRMLNAIEETTIRAAQKIVDPPLMAPDDGFLNPVKTSPGGMNYYRSDLSKDARIAPILTGGKPELGLELANQKRESIRRTFHVDWLNLPNGPDMTATEVLQRRDEKLRLLGPLFGRMATEFLGPLLSRTFRIELKNGRLPPPPDVMRGRGLKVDYTSPIAQAQKAADAEGMQRVLGLAEQMLSAGDTEALDVVDTEETLRTAQRLYSAPGKMLRSRDEVAARRQQRQQAQAQTAAGQNMKDLGSAAAGAGKGIQSVAAAMGGGAQQGA